MFRHLCYDVCVGKLVVNTFLNLNYVNYLTILIEERNFGKGISSFSVFLSTILMDHYLIVVSQLYVIAGSAILEWMLLRFWFLRKHFCISKRNCIHTLHCVAWMVTMTNNVSATLFLLSLALCILFYDHFIWKYQSRISPQWKWAVSLCAINSTLDKFFKISLGYRNKFILEEEKKCIRVSSLLIYEQLWIYASIRQRQLVKHLPRVFQIKL